MKERLKKIQSDFNFAWGKYGDVNHPWISKLDEKRSKILESLIGTEKVSRWKELFNMYNRLLTKTTNTIEKAFYREKAKDAFQHCKEING